MEECESLDSEMTELQEFQCEASETISQDDEDEVEELQNSLREVVQDPSVKPKLQCLMVDPSFSMVTVQSEDSGIVWETASSRCSTPWASETSSISEGYSMDGSGAAGKITIVFDEEKVVRRRTRSGGRSSRLGDRLSRPGSSRSASALGVERPEMAEVSLPNVKEEKTETEPDLEDIKNKDQQLFSLISEGYEILNIRVPSKLPTVDEEESTDLQDNLSYLDQTPKIKSRNHHDWTQQQNHLLPGEGEMFDHQEASEQDSPQPSADTELSHTPIQKETTSDIDYFEKFTLVDVVAPEEQAPEQQQKAEQPAPKPQVEELKPAKETATDSPAASEESFVFVTDVEISGEHLDQVFYGEGAPADAMQQRDDEDAEGGAGMRRRRESQRSGKESGAVLFGSEETTLTPIYISPGPPKIIDPILLEEPTAMSFMYSDLYEDAVGERRKSDEEYSEAESVTSEKSYRRRLSDSEEADGYLEKYTLKDDTPMVQVQPEPTEDCGEGRMMWSQSKFEMTGCLTRVVREDDEGKAKTEKPQTQTVTVGDRTEDLKSATFEEKKEVVAETEKEEIQLSGGLTVKEAEDVSIKDTKLKDDQMQDQEVKHEVKTEQTDPPESSTDKLLPETQQTGSKIKGKTEKTEEHQTELTAKTARVIKTEQPCQTQEVVNKTAQKIVGATGKTAVIEPVTTEVPEILTKSEIPAETTEKSLPEEAVTDTEIVAAEEKVVETQAPTEAKGPETGEKDMLTSTEIETSAETSQSEVKEAAEFVPEAVAPVEVITDCDAAVHAVVEVIEKAVDDTEIQTQVQIDLQEVASVKKADVQTAAPEREEVAAVTEETSVESQVPEFPVEADQVSEAKAEIVSEVTEPVMPEGVKTDSDQKQHDICEQNQQKESVPDAELAKTKLIPEVKDKTPTEDNVAAVQEKVNVGDELILLVPKGQAVEMDIEINKWTDMPTSDTVAVSEPESICESIKGLETTAICPETEVVITPETTTVCPETEGVIAPELTTICPETEVIVVPETTTVCPETEGIIASELTTICPETEGIIASETTTVCPDTEGIIASELTTICPETEGIIAPETTTICPEPEGIIALETTTVCPETEGVIAPELTTICPETEVIVVPETTTVCPETEGIIASETTTVCPDTEGITAPELTTICPETEVIVVPETTTVCPETEGITEPETTTICPEPEGIIAPETTALCPEAPQSPSEESMTEPPLEVKPEVTLMEEISPKDELDKRYSPPIHVQKEQKVELDFENDEGVLSPLRSFTPLEDLSGLHREDMQSEETDVKLEAELHEVEDAPETTKEVLSPEVELHREDLKQKMEQDEAIVTAPEAAVEESEYEVITAQDAKEMPKLETQRDAQEPEHEPGQEKEDRMEIEVEKERVFDASPEEELIEEDYEIIDAEEESQARLAAELQDMNWFCLTCGCLLSEDDYVSEEHQSHDVTNVDNAYEEIKEKLSDWISELQGRSENIEDLVSELELAYNSVEDQFVENEAAMQVQNEEMMALVMEQYNNMSVSMEEEKKAKLEQLYDQIVSFQESIDSAKATLETTAREAETDARSPEEILERLQATLDSAMSLELGPRGLLVFEDYAKGNTSSSHLTQRKGIPVPQKPTLQPQEPGSATSASVTVYWKVNPGDIIDCFQVYCMEDPQGAVSEEYRVTVKESYCVLEELEPDKTYKVWVMAVNYTGCSLPSERLVFRTAPSVPVIDTERCTVMWDSAMLRWSPTNEIPEQSYTLEYCRQYELEGEGLRSITGIKSCEQKVVLQPNENYLFYIKAVNEAGASEQSEAALISTKGTRFHLLKASAHPILELSEDQTTVHFSHDALENAPSTSQQCPSILGELLLAQGHYYWETIVSRSAAYRLGVAYSTANRASPLGENSMSWCLQCVPTPSGCRYQLLHNDVQSSVFVIEMPERVGTLLDYQLGRLSFYNVQSGQLLGTFCQRFTQPCHPALALDMPGSLEISVVLELPEFTKDS